MAVGFEFNFHTVSAQSVAHAEVDPSLMLLGAQGWEIRGLTALPTGEVLVALQRSLEDEHPLPDSPALSAALAAPLTPPPLDEPK